MFLVVTVRKLDYEVVKIFHEENHRLSDKVHFRSNPIVHLQAFDQDYTLYLEENIGVLLGEKTKIFLADVYESEIVYTEMKYVKRPLLINNRKSTYFYYINNTITIIFIAAIT